MRFGPINRTNGFLPDPVELNELSSITVVQVVASAAAVAAAAAMGQQLSGQAVSHLPEKLVKHIGLVRDSGYLTYEEFLARVAELNDV